MGVAAVCCRWRYDHHRVCFIAIFSSSFCLTTVIQDEERRLTLWIWPRIHSPVGAGHVGAQLLHRLWQQSKCKDSSSLLLPVHTPLSSHLSPIPRIHSPSEKWKEPMLTCHFSFPNFRNISITSGKLSTGTM